MHTIPIEKTKAFRVLFAASMLLVAITLARLPAAYKNEASLNHSAGVWIAMATDLADHGVFYRPLIDAEGYGGTRYFPLHFVLHAGLIKLGLDPFTSGFLLAALATAALRQQGLSRLIAFAIFLSIAEWLRGHLLTGFPWTAPGLAVTGMGGLAQTASLIGMPSLTLFVVLWASLPALLGFTRRSRREVIAACLLLALLLAGMIAPAAALGTASSDKAAYDQSSIARYHEMFAAQDYDGSGEVTREEVQGNIDFTATFDDIDIDRDGVVTRAELDRYLAAQFGSTSE